MAEIKTLPFVHHLRAEPTYHVLHYRRGELAREGAGLAFWFRAINSAIAEVPVDDRELPFLFRGRSRDFQELTVQGVITFRAADPLLVARRIDFSVDLDTGRWRQAPLEQVSALLTQLAQQFVIDELLGLDLREILRDGVAPIRDRIASGLAAEAALAELGLQVAAVRVAAVTPDAEVEKALQQPTRETIQQEADQATYGRRALAVESERAIADNELKNQIELARREEELVERQGANARRRAEEEAVARMVDTQAGSERAQIEAARQAETIDTVEAARLRAEAENARIQGELAPQTLLALALRELAGEIGKVDNLTITPDLLTPLIARPSRRTRRPERGRAMRPRCVLVERSTEYRDLLARHGTREQARFFLGHQGLSIDDVQGRHERHQRARSGVLADIPADWRIATVDRSELDRFLFADDDIVVVLGQDGLVANTAKYLGTQPVIGLNPDPDRNPGVLVRHLPEAAGDLLADAAGDRLAVERRTMVEAALDDGQRLLALNEIFLGHRSHQSARYTLEVDGASERQSSSGVIVASGTGATGWAASINGQRLDPLHLPAPTERALAWFVREPWPGPATGISLDGGTLDGRERLTATSELGEGATLFGDGIEADRLQIDWGQRATIGVAEGCLRLAV